MPIWKKVGVLTLLTYISSKDYRLQPVWIERRQRSVQSIIFRRKTRSEDGTEDGGRIRVVLYFLFKRPALERKKEVKEIGVMVKKTVTKGPYYV
jgi:hypothetical protein